MYRTMVECRTFEERAQQLFFEGLVRGTTHVGNGQEAVAAGFAGAMRADDYTFCTYRGLYSLDAPIVRITSPHVPLASAAVLEDLAMPSVERITDTIRRRLDDAR
jgi:hypothetical protein